MLMVSILMQTEDFPVLEEGDDGSASQSIMIYQEVTLTQSDSPHQLQQEVIVIVTDTESDDEEDEEEEEEPVGTLYQAECKL